MDVENLSSRSIFLLYLFARLRNSSQSARAAAAKPQEEIAGRARTPPANAPLLAAPPPTDNVWEKRAEERESAERERAAQKDALHQMRLQQHFPAVGEQSGQ